MQLLQPDLGAARGDGVGQTIPLRTQAQRFGHLIHEPGLPDDRLRLGALHIGQKLPRDPGQAACGQVQEHRRGQGVIFGLDRLPGGSQRVPATASQGQGAGVADIGLAGDPDGKGVVGNAVHQRAIAPVTCGGAAQGDAGGGQQVILDRLGQAGAGVGHMQGDWRVRAAEVGPVAQLTGQNAGQIG